MIKRIYGWEQPGLIDQLRIKFNKKDPDVLELLFKNIKVKHRNNTDQHGVYDQIPEKYRNSDREIVSIIRDPFTAYVSRYNYGSWKKHSSKMQRKLAKKIYAHYPDITFEEYVSSSGLNQSNRLQGIKLKDYVEVGVLTLQFLQMFTRNHRELIANIDKDFREHDNIMDHFPEITFLKNENLNHDLADFLIKHGFTPKETKFIFDANKKNVSTNDSFKSYLTDKAVDEIVKREWFLFDLFPEYLPDKNPLFN
ncbi:MAG: hypothetical protein JJU37_16970 [Balneolaceae bacterium]|nr:hypothetical protein [Balneolaceae bacterium]